jgi:hypothetical protein
MKKTNDPEKNFASFLAEKLEGTKFFSFFEND